MDLREVNVSVDGPEHNAQRSQHNGCYYIPCRQWIGRSFGVRRKPGHIVCFQTGIRRRQSEHRRRHIDQYALVSIAHLLQQGQHTCILPSEQSLLSNSLVLIINGADVCEATVTCSCCLMIS